MLWEVHFPHYWLQKRNTRVKADLKKKNQARWVLWLLYFSMRPVITRSMMIPYNLSMTILHNVMTIPYNVMMIPYKVMKHIPYSAKLVTHIVPLLSLRVRPSFSCNGSKKPKWRSTQSTCTSILGCSTGPGPGRNITTTVTTTTVTPTPAPQSLPAPLGPGEHTSLLQFQHQHQIKSKDLILFRCHIRYPHMLQPLCLRMFKNNW